MISKPCPYDYKVKLCDDLTAGTIAEPTGSSGVVVRKLLASCLTAHERRKMRHTLYLPVAGLDD